MIDEIEKLILDSSEVVKKSISLSNEIEKCIKIIINCFVNDNKVILFGNGSRVTVVSFTGSDALRIIV